MPSPKGAKAAASDSGDNIYAFTQTLNNRLFKSKTSEEQYDQTHLHLYEILVSLGCKNILLVAELTQSSDVHYHAQFTLPGRNLDKVRYIVNNRMRKCKFFGYRCIKLVTEEKIWLDYLLKDLKTTREMLSRQPIICDDCNLVGFNDFDLYGIKI